MKTLLCITTQWTKHLLSNDSVEVFMIHIHGPWVVNDEVDNGNVLPTTSIVKPPHYIKFDRRYKSAREYYSTTMCKRESHNVAMVCGDVAFASQYQSVTTTKVKRSKKNQRHINFARNMAIYKKYEVLTKDNLGTFGVACSLRDIASREDLANEIHRTSRVKRRPN